MDKTLQATYEHGVFKLDSPLELPEQSRVSILVIAYKQMKKAEESTETEAAEAEFDKMLNEFSFSGRKPLPSDFSRADIYSDHD